MEFGIDAIAPGIFVRVGFGSIIIICFRDRVFMAVPMIVGWRQIVRKKEEEKVN